MELFEKTIASDVKYEGKILSLRVDTVTLPDGRETRREIIGHHGGVGIVAVTDENEIILVRQFRAGTHDVTLEIPAGKLEKGENPLECGKRELMEETGYTAEGFEELTAFYGSPAILEEKIHVYLAKGLKAGVSHPDPGEFVEIVKMPFGDAKKLALSGKLNDAKTIIGILLASEYLK